MRKYAILNNNIVTSIMDLEDDQVASQANLCSMIIDITDLSIEPVVGWVLDGNRLVSNTVQTEDELYDEQQTAQRVFGQKLSPKLVDRTGALNLKLATQGNLVNVTSLLTNLNGIKALLETGALKTARSAIVSVKPAFPIYDSIFQYALDEITNFLTENNYE